MVQVDKMIDEILAEGWPARGRPGIQQNRENAPCKKKHLFTRCVSFSPLL